VTEGNQPINPGPGSTWDATFYQSHHAFVWKYGQELVELLAPRPGHRVLDLGCGTGQLAGAIAARGADVIGIDHSPEMVAQARANFPALRFEEGDARTFSVEQPVDAVFSNAVLHWVKPAGAVVDRVWRALQRGGRFVAEFGGAGNVRVICDAIRGAMEETGYGSFDAVFPWYYPTIARYAGELERRGFDVTFATLFDRPTALEGEAGMRNWVRMFGGTFLAAMRPEDHERFLSAVERHARPGLYRDGKWHADYRRLRVVAYKPRPRGNLDP
jgi:trans-aconitate 2-methyltransferase